MKKLKVALLIGVSFVVIFGSVVIAKDMVMKGGSSEKLLRGSKSVETSKVEDTEEDEDTEEAEGEIKKKVGIFKDGVVEEDSGSSDEDLSSIEAGAHGDIIYPETISKEECREYIVDILVKCDTYKDEIENAKYEVKVSDDFCYIFKFYLNSGVLYVKCADDGIPYRFYKTSEFTEEENNFYMYLGSGTSGSSDGIYYWDFV